MQRKKHMKMQMKRIEFKLHCLEWNRSLGLVSVNPNEMEADFNPESYLSFRENALPMAVNSLRFEEFWCDSSNSKGKYHKSYGFCQTVCRQTMIF
ncbi:hypothetical protein TNCV_2119351 [Trichonephila clavipes]|nr:hypothetical protein TNCV_2119351 [Trichonephila clavipes]